MARSIYRPTLRRRVLLVVTLVALSPLIFIALSVPYESFLERWMVGDMESTIEQIPRGATPEEVREVLERERLWGRIVVNGAVARTFEYGTSPRDINLAGIAEPEARFWFAEWDAREPPLAQRPEVLRAAASEGPQSRCTLGRNERLLVCSVAARIATEQGPAILHLTTANVRNVRALSDSAVVQLAYQVLLVALLVGLWLSRRVLKPVESLREQVRKARGEPPRAGAPTKISVDDDTEIGELAEEFDALLGDLEARRRANEAFAADLAHELKNPVAAIQACAENMESGMVEPEQLDRYVGVLQRSSTKLQHLIDQFLTLARAEAGLEQSQRAVVDLAGLVRRVCERFAADPRFESNELQMELEPCEVIGARDALETAVEKIVENALEVSDDGDSVCVRLECDAGRALLSVTDRGPGLAPEDLEHVFDRFFTRRAGGTGLGLPIARAVTEAHGGSVSVESTPGEGSTFMLRFPLRREESPDSHTTMTQE